MDGKVRKKAGRRAVVALQPSVFREYVQRMLRVNVGGDCTSAIFSAAKFHRIEIAENDM